MTVISWRRYPAQLGYLVIESGSSRVSVDGEPGPHLRVTVEEGQIGGVTRK